MRPLENTPLSAKEPGLYDRLPPLERDMPALRRPTPVVAADRAAAPERLVSTPPPPSSDTVEVRYGLDTVAGVWVAQFFDGVTGEFVKTVPATRVTRQLATLRELDAGVDVAA